ncbi:hypothetical protein BpHYR1_037384 [Brachionus plicatilis]|uniref:RNA-directed DNA polymerase from mobile element jockey-like n=1 Tax=Brachionus plicatilis TaxID=10195 RepID=A0A3M7QK84_BRAPC|nr:hypothetical protein BpHYR1_037384 [Brachionus plicatilis]
MAIKVEKILIVRNTFNSRLWRIMKINDQTAGSYKLLPIAEFIDHVCEQTLNRILADPNHLITSCQQRNFRLNARFPFQTRNANKAAFRNSFLQKILRKLRKDSNSQNARASLHLKDNKSSKEKIISEYEAMSLQARREVLRKFYVPKA